MKNIIIHTASRCGHNWVLAMIRNWVPYPDKVYRFENVVPNRIAVEKRRYKVRDDLETVNIVLARDFLNWAASWLKFNLRHGLIGNEQEVNRGFKSWFRCAQEYCGKTNNYGTNKLPVLYDDFFYSRTYRMAICGLLGGLYNEEMIDLVPLAGGGSSFDQRALQGSGSNMETLYRWKWFLTEEGQKYDYYLTENNETLLYYMERMAPSSDQIYYLHNNLKIK